MNPRQDLAVEVKPPRGLVAASSPQLFRREREAATAERARALDGRVFQHRTTGEIRAAAWHPASIEFFDPKQPRYPFHRPHRKALQWCEQADDITPTVEAESEGGEL